MRRLSLLPLIVFVSVSSASAQWQVQNSGTDASLRGISAVSNTVAWASGSKGTVLRTVDGGQRWETLAIPDAVTLDFRDIQAFDAQTAFVLSSGPGEASRIYRTNDGGGHWQRQFINTEPNAFYDGFAFWDSKHGIAMSDPVNGSFLLRVTEDGQNWKPLVPETLPAALPKEGGFAASGTSIAIAGKNEVWFATGGPSARLFHSSDRGKHWSVIETPLLSGAPSQGIFSIALAGKAQGVIVGGDYEKPQAKERVAAFRSPGDRGWVLSETPPAGYRSAVAFVPGVSPLLWIAVGTSGSDYSTDGGKTWRPLDSQNYNAVSFANDSAGWAVGPKGKIARFTGLPQQ